MKTSGKLEKVQVVLTQKFSMTVEKNRIRRFRITLFFGRNGNDRYIEVWNVVFSQYDPNPTIDRKEYKELPQKNIDTRYGT